MSLIFRAGLPLKANRLNALVNGLQVNGSNVTAFSTTSATFVTLGTTARGVFTKFYSSTSVWASIHVGSYCAGGAAPTVAEFAVHMGTTPATDTPVVRVGYDLINDNRSASGFVRLPQIDAGTYFATVYGRRVSGTGTPTLDAYSLLYMRLCEIQE